MPAVKLTQVVRHTTGRDGQPLMTRDGRPYTRLNIKTQEYGDKWLSGFSADWNKHWAVGYSADIEVESVRSADGLKEYLNFSKADPLAAMHRRIEELEQRLNFLIAKGEPEVNPPKGIDYPEEDINPNDIPF